MCDNNKCKRRDNKFGVTWCVLCGKLFNKPCDRKLAKEDEKYYKYNHQQPKQKVITGIF